MKHEFNVISDCLISVGTCFVLSAVFVASLYVWNSQHDRNHSSTIKRRFLSVFIMMLISPVFLYLAVNEKVLKKKTIWEILGIRSEGLIQAFILPLLLTMILFLGPISMQIYNGILNVYTEPRHWISNMKNLIWLRNHVVAPLSEEFTFRSCMLPLLLQCFRPLTAVFICPLFFGAGLGILQAFQISFLVLLSYSVFFFICNAIRLDDLEEKNSLFIWPEHVPGHFHHMIEKIRSGIDVKSAFLISCFHFTYTTIFGTYSAYIFLRTGHLASTFIAHAFCNHMGFPDIQELANYKGKQRATIIFLFVIGFVLWCYLLNPLTEPKWYYNDIDL